MKARVGIVAVGFALGFASQASASNVGPAYVQNGVLTDSGAGIFTLSANPPSYAACANQQRYAVNLATPAGQAMWASILTALKSHSQVSVVGKGVCDVWGDTESVQYLQVFP